MALIALKIDVDTLRGTQEGVPRLLEMLQTAGANATFLFSLGPDHTGRALKRMFRRGFLKKVARTSVLSVYGLKTLLYGVLLPGPDIGKRAGVWMRRTRQAGFECGIHTWDHVLWQDQVRRRDAAWTQQQMQLAYQRFCDIFDAPPTTHGAAGWQMNAAAFAELDRWGLQYASDGRGIAPYRIVLDQGACTHIQIPTTLPTLDEIVGRDGVTLRNAASTILAITAKNSSADSIIDSKDAIQVFTLHAELEGGAWRNIFQELLNGWKMQGHRLASLQEIYQTLNRKKIEIPCHPLKWATVDGRSGELIAQ